MERVKERYIRQVKMMLAMLRLQEERLREGKPTDYPTNKFKLAAPLEVHGDAAFFLQHTLGAVETYLSALQGINPYDPREGAVDALVTQNVQALIGSGGPPHVYIMRPDESIETIPISLPSADAEDE